MDARLFEDRDPFHRPSTVLVPNARTSDPETAKAAGRAIEASGAGEDQRNSVYTSLIDHPGVTSRELAEAMGLSDRYICSRRLPELERAGLARRGSPRKCRSGGRVSETWWAIIRS
jgi:hypothetical protein